MGIVLEEIICQLLSIVLSQLHMLKVNETWYKWS